MLDCGMQKTNVHHGRNVFENGTNVLRKNQNKRSTGVSTAVTSIEKVRDDANTSRLPKRKTRD